MPVLVGFAPTPEGWAAVLRAVSECALRGTGLILVSSERQDDERPGDDSPGDDGRGEGGRGDGGGGGNDRYETAVRTACAELGLPDPGHEIRVFTGSVEPADDVLSVAQESGAELIVIGLRRRTPVGKLILGGSAQRILLESSCPVLAVKGSPGQAWPGATREPAAANQ